MAVTVCSAASESAASARVTSSCTRSSTTSGSPDVGSATGVTSATPSTPDTVVTIASRSSAGPMTVAGLPLPAGKCRASASWPSVASTVARKKSDCATPCARNVGRKAASTTSTSVTPTQTRRGRPSTRRATRPQNPRTSVGALPYAGRKGQNAARPSSASTAGRNVKEASMAAAIPSAATGPSPWVEFSSLSSSAITPSTTVPPEARIASYVPRSEARMASYLDVCRRSSSRKRATSSSE